MNSNLWDDHQTASDSTDSPQVTTTASEGGEPSPLTAAIEGSSWSYEDVRLALQAAQVVLLAVWVAHTYSNE